MEKAPKANSLAQNYFLMFYHATFIFNMVDVAPVTYTEIASVIVVIIISAFANALLYGTFFSLRRDQNALSQELADEINVCRSTNKELDVQKKLRDAIIYNV